MMESNISIELLLRIHKYIYLMVATILFIPTVILYFWPVMSYKRYAKDLGEVPIALSDWEIAPFVDITIESGAGCQEGWETMVYKTWRGI